MSNNRRVLLIERLGLRCSIQDMGFFIEGSPSPCHIWTGPTSGRGRGGGYGRISVNGVTCATHIVAFTHYHGYVPPSRQVDHLCNQRLCCNPQHLELVTHLKNQRRRAKRAKDENKPKVCIPTEPLQKGEF